MMIFDWHLDLAWNAIEWNRDLRQTVEEIRRRETASGVKGPGRGTNTVSLPALRAGRVAVVCGTLLARHDRAGPRLSHIPKSGFDSAEAAAGSAWGQLAYYRALERTDQIRILSDWPAFEAHVHEWGVWLESHHGAAPVDATPPKLGVIIAMEGADPILSPEHLDEWWQAGLRVLSLSHYGVSRYSHGTGTPGPLTPMGIAMLSAMHKRGVILDVTHLADDAMDQALDGFGGVLLASHHNCRSLVDRQRQLRDSDIRKIVARGGVIGAAMDNWMLDFAVGQAEAVKPRTASLATVADHIDRVCQLAGSARHAALGTDLDGGFGTEQSPADLDTIADLQRLVAILERRGYSKADVRGICHGNWLDLMRRAWTA